MAEVTYRRGYRGPLADVLILDLAQRAGAYARPDPTEGVSLPIYWPPSHNPHWHRPTEVGRKVAEHGWMTVAGHFSDVGAASTAMGIDWMTRDELRQAIPPAYTEWIGARLLDAVRERAA